jgi:putative ABC transport system ATP-binding protein
MNPAPGKPSPLVAFENVTHEFDDGRIVALRNVSIEIEPGKSIAVLGPSGSGKTTLVLLMCGIRMPSQGVVRWEGEAVASARAWTLLRRFRIGIVFQDFNLLPTLSAVENVEIPMFGTGIGSRERRRRAAAAIESVGLTARATHLPHELSGGERQRVAIARSMVNNPALIVADEPTGNLDTASSEAVMDLLFELHRARGTTLVVVTHNPSLAERCEHRIRIGDGRVFNERMPGVCEVTA